MGASLFPSSDVISNRKTDLGTSHGANSGFGSATCARACGVPMRWDHVSVRMTAATLTRGAAAPSQAPGGALFGATPLLHPAARRPFASVNVSFREYPRSGITQCGASRGRRFPSAPLLGDPRPHRPAAGYRVCGQRLATKNETAGNIEL